MPDLDGLALSRAFAALDPRLTSRTVIVTGDGTFRWRDGETASPDIAVLEKPFTIRSVETLLDRMMAP